MRLILVSTVAGQNVASILEALGRFSRAYRGTELIKVGESTDSAMSRQVALWAKVEDHLLELAKPYLDKYPEETTEYGVEPSQVFGMPTNDLEKICHEAFERSVRVLLKSGTDLAFLAFHPVLYHQITREFFFPYDTHRLYRLLADSGASLRHVVSVHDDIYDIYPNLTQPNALWAIDIVRRGTMAPLDKRGRESEVRSGGVARDHEGTIERLPEKDIEQDRKSVV